MLVELGTFVAQKRTTLIFTNTRSGAEHIGVRLKQLMPDIAKLIEVHHASLDRTVRLEVEDRLNRGELRAVVCSTSLEMGIDIGSIDTVVMVSAPKGVVSRIAADWTLRALDGRDESRRPRRQQHQRSRRVRRHRAHDGASRVGAGEDQ